MCTVTFIPRREGYLLAMNRDERITRGQATPPTVLEIRSVQVLYPRDVQGGTWIAASSRGIAFALLNWNDARVVQPKNYSRGCVIPALIGCSSVRNADATLNRFDFQGILPFKLIGFFPSEKQIAEWRWDQDSLIRESFAWDSRQWCSSSLSDAQATVRRGLAYTRAQDEDDVNSVVWLRRLHACHDQENPPFSTCVHRSDVETVSYTELNCTPHRVQCHYIVRSPCGGEAGLHSVAIRRHVCTDAMACA
ncbi:MAG: hypothetical protein DMG97_16185 [Acidobacteria bacterium]|nr:MAG: hypothetical protein DMG97_16185 [Acidobacteriota bacterium]PYV75608.1 MAG: hypothetical protein DMG96_16750 [Acidobacteriota bacterium]